MKMLEIDKEYFLLSNEINCGRYKINKDGELLKYCAEKNYWFRSNVKMSDCITYSHLRFVPAHFVPVQGEKYWTINYRTGSICLEIFDKNNLFDIFFLATGFCFKTPEEAKANKENFERMLKDIKNGKRLILADYYDPKESKK